MKRILRQMINRDERPVEHLIGMPNFNPNAFVGFNILNETIIRSKNCVAKYLLKQDNYNYNFLGRYPMFSNSYDMNYLAIDL